jgi:hypothetical protein
MKRTIIQYKIDSLSKKITELSDALPVCKDPFLLYDLHDRITRLIDRQSELCKQLNAIQFFSNFYK